MSKALEAAAYGRFVKIEETGKSGRQGKIWRCHCQCGTVIEARASSVRSGSSKSCGCLQRDRTSERHKKHGYAGHVGRKSEYMTWQSMVQRCHNPNDKAFKNYGGRGIAVCSRWRSFENFIEDMGNRPGNQYTIERINNDDDYNPENCRWATRKEQSRNTRQCVPVRRSDGVEYATIAEAAENNGVDRNSIRAALDKPSRSAAGYSWETIGSEQ